MSSGNSDGSDAGQKDRPAVMAALTEALRAMSAQAVLFSQAVADRLGMNPTDLESLDVLWRTGPVSAGRLAEVTGLTTGAITGVLDRLERAGYVRREQDPKDRRRVICHLIPNRVLAIAPLFEPMRRAVEALSACYSDEQLALILDFASRANVIAHEETVRLRAERWTAGDSQQESGEGVWRRSPPEAAPTARVAAPARPAAPAPAGEAARSSQP